MQTARLIATKNPEALAGAHRVENLKAFDCAFDGLKHSKASSISQVFWPKREASRALKVEGGMQNAA